MLVGTYLSLSAQTSRRELALSLVKLAAIFAGTYLVTTPATVFDARLFTAGVRYELHHYATGHVGHTVSPGLAHGWSILIYFSSVIFSYYQPIALMFFAFSVIGVFSLSKESPRKAVLFLCFPVLYLLYFSSQRAMVVRNLLVVIPYLAVTAARGAAILWGCLRRMSSATFEVGRAELNLPQTAFALIILASLLVNCGWLVYATETIVDRHTDRFINEVAHYISADSGRRYFLSPRVRVQLATLFSQRAPNITDDPAQADQVIFYASEGLKSWKDWPANRPWLTTWFGPHEVNFNIYPNWWGDDRILVMSMRKVRSLHLLVFYDREQ